MMTATEEDDVFELKRKVERLSGDLNRLASENEALRKMLRDEAQISVSGEIELNNIKSRVVRLSRAYRLDRDGRYPSQFNVDYIKRSFAAKVCDEVLKLLDFAVEGRNALCSIELLAKNVVGANDRIAFFECPTKSNELIAQYGLHRWLMEPADKRSPPYIKVMHAPSLPDFPYHSLQKNIEEVTVKTSTVEIVRSSNGDYSSRVVRTV